jgi:chromosome segregation ATPase
MPNHPKRIRSKLDALIAERASLMERLQAAASTGDEGDALAKQIEELDRDIARRRLQLQAAEADQERARSDEQIKALAKQRKNAEKLLDKYQASAERAERCGAEFAEAIAQMRKDFAEFEAATPDRGGTAYASTVKPQALIDRLLEVLRERIARQVKRADSAMPASSARIERMSVGDAFASKRAGLLPWLAK